MAAKRVESIFVPCLDGSSILPGSTTNIQRTSKAEKINNFQLFSFILVQSKAKLLILLVSNSVSIFRFINGLTNNPFSVTDNPFSVTDNPFSVTDNPLSVTDNPLSVTDNPFSVTDNPLSVTNHPFSVKNATIAITAHGGMRKR